MILFCSRIFELNERANFVTFTGQLCLASGAEVNMRIDKGSHPFPTSCFLGLARNSKPAEIYDHSLSLTSCFTRMETNASAQAEFSNVHEIG